jgi:signal transduction histidine kinase
MAIHQSIAAGPRPLPARFRPRLRRDLAGPGLALLLTTVAGLIAGAVAPAILALDLGSTLLLIMVVGVLRSRSLELYDRSSFSISVVPTIAAAALLGVPGAVVVAPVSALVRGLQHRSAWYKVLFNASSYVIAGAAAAWVFERGGVAVTPANLMLLLPIAALAGVVYYLHTIFIASAIAAERGLSPSRVWVEHFRWLGPQYAALGMMGLLLALAQAAFGLAGAAVFLVPPLMMHLVAKQYIDRTQDNVRELRAEIAHRIAAEEENARLAKEAARAAALQETSELKSRFISIASHELRTPLTAVVGYTELVLIDTPEDDPRRAMLHTAHRSAVHMGDLIGNLLDASRVELGKMTVHPRSVDLGAAVRSVVETVGATTDRHSLCQAVAPEARWVLADPERLDQILTNLVGNAVKYSPAGGQVLVTARCGADGRVELSVSDQGVGIPAEELDRIFDPYQRANQPTNRQIKGTGLGLYIVHHLVELHGGTIRVESTLGRGSTFVVALPAADPDSPGDRS